MGDWRQQGLVTGVKNQGRCGSCYSFSASGALEGAWAKSRGQLPTLSESQIVDCSGRYGNHGCQGGRYQSSWQYLQSCGGDMSESAYPYMPRKGWCRFNRGQVVATVSGYQNVRGESSLTNAIGSVGPVSVAIDASPRSLRSYRYGVFLRPKLFILPYEPRRARCRLRKRRWSRLLLGQELVGRRLGCRWIHQDVPKPRKQLRYC